MRVLLTGGTGFIGANLVRQLLAQGDEVRCLVRKARMALEGLDVELVQLPMVDQPDAIDDLARAMEGCEGVYHVAGLFDPGPGGIQRMRDVHVFGTRALLRAMEKASVPRMVLCSSSVTVGFGSKEAPGNEDRPLDPTAIYGTRGALRAYYDTKLQAEQLGASWSGVEVVIVNPDFILGAWDVKPTSGQSIVTMARRGVPVYPKGGKCFQDADDCAIGHIRAMERGLPGRRYLLGNENLSYQEFLSIVAEVVGKKPPRFPVPDLAIFAAGQVGKWGARMDAHRFAGLDPHVLRSMQQARYRSGQRAFDELEIPRTPIRLAVEKAYKWFCEHGYC